MVAWLGKFLLTVEKYRTVFFFQTFKYLLSVCNREEFFV